MFGATDSVANLNVNLVIWFTDYNPSRRSISELFSVRPEIPNELWGC